MYQQHDFLGRRSVLAIEMKTTIFCEVCANGHAFTQYIIVVQWVLHLLGRFLSSSWTKIHASKIQVFFKSGHNVF